MNDKLMIIGASGHGRDFLSGGFILKEIKCRDSICNVCDMYLKKENCLGVIL